MDKNLPYLYRDYGQYSNWRNLPLDIDGLKPVERRVLLAAYKVSRNGFVKSRQVDAYTIGHYHPHGSTYGTIVQLVRQGFLTGQGNFGANIGVEPVGPAADRYTECRINSKTIDLMFRYMKNVQQIDTELGDKEPIFLPTLLPVCLMGKEYTQGIGFGYKTTIPCYKMTDLYKRLLWLLGKSKTKPTIKPITDCKIISPPEVLEQLLTTGQAKVEVEGIMDVKAIKNEVILKSWPPGRKFEVLLNKFAKELNENMIGFTDLSKTSTEIVFQVLRERNRDKIFKEFVESLKEAITGNISFEITVVDINKKVLVKSVDNMLLDTYKMFCDINNSMLLNEIRNLDNIMDEYQILTLIKPDVLYCIEKKLEYNETIEYISNKNKLDIEVIKGLLDKYKIKKLLTITSDVSELVNQKNILIQHTKQLDQFVLNQYNELIK